MVSLVDANVDYKGLRVLNNVNLNLKAGNIYAVGGDAGKNTLIRVLTGLVPISSGGITMDDETLDLNAAFLLDDIDFINDLTGYEVIKIMNEALARTEILKVLDRVRLMEVSNLPTKEYDMDKKTRLKLACLLVNPKKVVILENIYKNVDKKYIDIITEIIFELKARGCIVIITGDDINDFKFIANGLYNVLGGRVNEILF